MRVGHACVRCHHLVPLSLRLCPLLSRPHRVATEHLASLLWLQNLSAPHLSLLQGDTSSDYLIHTKVLIVLMTECLLPQGMRNDGLKTYCSSWGLKPQ